MDIVAAYTDHIARYLNYTGAGVIWDCPAESLNPLIDELLRAGQAEPADAERAAFWAAGFRDAGE